VRQRLRRGRLDVTLPHKYEFCRRVSGLVDLILFAGVRLPHKGGGFRRFTNPHGGPTNFVRLTEKSKLHGQIPWRVRVATDRRLVARDRWQVGRRQLRIRSRQEVDRMTGLIAQRQHKLRVEI